MSSYFVTLNCLKGSIMKTIFAILVLVFGIVTPALAQQRVVAECTVMFKITLDDGTVDKDVSNSISKSAKTVYIKGNDSRVDLVSPAIQQSVIYDKTQNTAVVLREFGTNKFMNRLNKEQWLTANKQYQGMAISLVNETKTILGYECKKAMITLKDGSVFSLYYATAIIPSVKEFEYQFKDVPGFVLEYQIKESGDNTLVNYRAEKISLSPVLASKFDIPTSGYRLMN
jgi:GLPGLI family protein